MPELEETQGEVLICGDCNATVSALVSRANHEVCAECANHYARCRHCRTDLHEQDVRFWDGGRAYCQDCYASVFMFCDYCGESCRQAETRYAGGYGDICESCYDNVFNYCEHCDTVYHNEGSCQCDGQAGEVRIRSHSYKPVPHFFEAVGETPDQQPYAGVELEFGFPDTFAARRHVGRHVGQLPWCYLKHDGSVGGEVRDTYYVGVELVTHPFTERWLVENRAAWDALLRGLTDGGCLSGARVGAGLHVHLGRTGFEGTRHLYRFMRLFYEDKRWTQLLSGREVAALQQWASMEDPLIRVGRKILHDAKGNKPTFRYAGINLVPEHTVEVRLFNGTLSTRRFHTRVETMFAALQFTREELRTKLVTPRHFTAWVTQHAERFPHLFGTLQDNPQLRR